MSSNSKSNKKETKNIKALFSVVCICIIALGLIVYFSTNSKSDNDTVNEATTIEETTKEITTDVQHAVTVTETTEKTTAEKTTEKSTEPSTMEQGESNTPYKSFYKYPMTEAVLNGYSEELVYDETMGDYRAHAAVDFSGNTGDEVVAINDGLVLDVYTDNLYGTVVEIDHGGTLIAKYCGLESVSVKKGSYVNIGNKIGTLGSVPIEGALAAHLHFECSYDSKTVNPLDVMGKTE
ncbi:MAG: peptidoglycan DD-metalloendopeptidase family protein [Eubacterium sp.]